MKKKRKWPKYVLIALLLALIAGGIYAYSVYSNFTTTLDTMHEPVEREQPSVERTEIVEFDQQDPFSVLLLGVDEREDDRGRSDTMVVMTVNPETQSTKMVSIPRDTYTEIIGRGTTDKINHAYAFGGIEMSMNTTENLLDIPIDYVVQVNMEGFEDIVDAVDGVTVNNSLAFDNFQEGEIHLDGEEALEYVRMRYEDPRGDFGRQDRQKQVIQGVMRKGASINSLWNYKDIFDALGQNVRTNMTFDEMVDVQRNYQDAVTNVDQMIVEDGYGETINGIWYYMMDDAELAEIQSTLKEHLELEEATE
ncbi:MULTISPECIES: LytR family transcriptional regulator [unclassified Planococcus (in: firmicutes)]|uniref:LCP family glycopolymer transferase n=1 Tax=unclassified Planococcus (in: firmicutes) TaxID=2662419 RepID=UPI000C33A66C|nr:MULTISPECIES: LytR family transcriptional regulator [unclassified Planococcus (in: firmicutes)]AUD14488.1 LytR family transcriptional regulator [Planococcus sp. MB-3u-03]PKG44769.1 LytR family transcriptional regulator [Planococcus sp. Urea-trap-24]PKG87111.1 LytR family transcriptional regulator [Planococcus sp. Urea-3u-39]PKH40215.1 LytR family transcriptional regulator [Planococcus sp. MB-3u-09]